jgi:LacI family transcriptional regulator
MGVTLKDIARAAQVHNSTVSRALRNDPQIPPETRLRVQEVARKLGYNPNPLVTALMTNRRHKSSASTVSIACISDNPVAEVPGRHPWSDLIHEGMKTRAKSLGFELEIFFLDQYENNGEALIRVLHARGFAGLLWANQQPIPITSLTHQFSMVVVGKDEIDYSSVKVDDCQLVLLAMEKALEAGYRRPGVILRRGLESQMKGTQIALAYSQKDMKPAARIPLFDSANTAADALHYDGWLKRYKPDVIISNASHPFPGYPLITLDWIAEFHDQPHPFPGINQARAMWGSAAVDLLAAHLYHHEAGDGEFARHVLIHGRWIDPR